MSNIGYVGRQPNDTSVVIAEQQYTLLGGETQLTFTAGYDIGYVDVYKNGLRLREGAEFSATDGRLIDLVVTGAVSDNFEVVAYKSFNPNDSVTNIDVNFARIGVEDNGTSIGIGVTLNFLGAGNTFSVTPLASGNIINLKLNNYADVAGIATVAEGLTGTPDIEVRNVTGAAATFSGTLSAGNGTVTLEENLGITVTDGAVDIYQATSNITTKPFTVSSDVGGTQVEKAYINAAGDASFAGDVEVTGIITAATFSGDATGLSGTPDLVVGVVTATIVEANSVFATSFIGDLSGTADLAEGLTGTPDIVVGVVTATDIESPDISANTITLGNVNSPTVGILTSVVTQDYFRIEKALFRNYGEVVYTYGNTGGTPNVDIANGNTVVATLNQNATFTFSNSNSLGSTAAYGFLLQLTNSTGGLAITWPTNVQWAGGSVPIRNSDANRTDIWSFFTTDGGTQWMGNLTISGYTL